MSFCVRALWTPVNSYGPLVILVQGPKALEIILLVRALMKFGRVIEFGDVQRIAQ